MTTASSLLPALSPQHQSAEAVVLAQIAKRCGAAGPGPPNPSGPSGLQEKVTSEIAARR